MSLPMLLAIDPSMLSLGWATVNLTNGSLVEAGGIKSTVATPKEWYPQSVAMVREIEVLLDTTKPQIVVVETPNNWFTERGDAAKDSESVQKLYYTTGGIVAAACRTQATVYVVTPQAWKGQTPKGIMVTRATILMQKQGLPLCAMPHDVAEAILLATEAGRRVHTTILDKDKECHYSIRNPNYVPLTANIKLQHTTYVTVKTCNS